MDRNRQTSGAAEDHRMPLRRRPLQGGEEGERLRAVRDALRAAQSGELAVRLPLTGGAGDGLLLDEVALAFNGLVAQRQARSGDHGWLKAQLARLTELLEDPPAELETLADRIVSELATAVGAHHAALYLVERESAGRWLRLLAAHASRRRQPPARYQLGEGLVGRCAEDGKPLVVPELPDGQAMAVHPIRFEHEVRAVLELGSLHPFEPVHLELIEQLARELGPTLQLVGASRAAQSKAQFLANLSHEVRTPLNSMMILAQLLAANEESTLSTQQQQWASTIHSAGRDLLALLNQVLDLSKVEAGKLEPTLRAHSVSAMLEVVEKIFRPVALQRQLTLTVELAPGAPEDLVTDRLLLEQILKNLLANAFKFTVTGGVTLRIAPEGHGQVAFAVTDTGIGIPPDKQLLIFEAFQQADGSTSRKYGGTGLGLSISRELTRLLGGELRLASRPGEGSTFTLVLPLVDQRATVT
jgi:signal transduction histidine kinase